ncbi:hypothetical protein PG997_013631 [Apiospora hydei]|uniref:Nucleoside phosphorylase domain-containing protein n=1 Tax=Apiospora hydei TaxID=1337664 RepID=A0ABR1V6P4_9PEZI
MEDAPRKHEDYTVGWVCALPKEQTAAIAMLDERHESLPKLSNDSNAYTLGSIGRHNIVIACLPKGKIGTSSAAEVASRMVGTFPRIRFGLMVGIGGGVPPNVQLGDVVVSVPIGQLPGVVQWDIGKAEDNGHFARTGALNDPPTLLLTALTQQESAHELDQSRVPEYLEALGRRSSRLAEKYLRSDRLQDVLFNADYSHVPNVADSGVQYVDQDTCKRCDINKSVKREPRGMKVHYGTIASGNQVIKDAAVCDQLSKDLGGILCVEMEAAGLMDTFPCIVIRGVCDYADSHKIKAWQEHAAAVAAAFAKDLLGYVQPGEVSQERTAQEQIYGKLDILTDGVKSVQQHFLSEDERRILDWLSPLDYGPRHSDHLQRREEGTCNWLLESETFVPDVIARFNQGDTLEIRARSDDVQIYVKRRIQQWPSFIQDHPDLQRGVITTISEVIDGMFLLAQIYLESLFNKLTPSAMRDAIEAMRELQKQTLKTDSKGTSEALSKAHDKLIFDKDNLPRIQDVLSVCCGLVTLDEESDEIRLVHYTTQEYLESRQQEFFPDVHSLLTTTCTAYLSSHTFEGDDFDADDPPFYHYAACHWSQHAIHTSSCDYVEHSLKRTSAVQFAFDRIWRFTPDGDLGASFVQTSMDVRPAMTGLQLAAFFGLTGAVNIMLKSYDVDFTDGKNSGTPLWWAASQGHKAMVELLIKKGANIEGNTECERKMVELLLRYDGVDVNARNVDGASSLCLASERGHKATVDLLIEKRADLEIKKKGGTALLLAVKGGYEDIAEVLIKNGADVKIGDSDGFTPLWHASYQGRGRLVGLLVGRGADINAKNMMGRTPLMMAELRGHTDVVKFLTEHSIDITTGGNNSRGPLSMGIPMQEAQDLDHVVTGEGSNCVLGKRRRESEMQRHL